MKSRVAVNQFTPEKNGGDCDVVASLHNPISKPRLSDLDPCDLEWLERATLRIRLRPIAGATKQPTVEISKPLAA